MDVSHCHWAGPRKMEKKILYMEELNPLHRANALVYDLSIELQVAQLDMKLDDALRADFEKNQKEYILREQLEYIKEELGDKVQYSDTQDLEEKLEKLKASDEVKEKIKKEIARLKMVAGASSESVIERVYIETLLEYGFSTLKLLWKTLFSVVSVAA